MTVNDVLGWGCVVALSASVALGHLHPFGDAGLYAQRNGSDAVPATIPADVRHVLETKCADCHSSVLNTPLYGRFAPISWLLERDIVEARQHMNLSDWNSYTPDHQDELKAEIVQQVRSGKMPVLQYRMVHWPSSVTPAELEALVAWAHGSPAGGDLASHALQPGDATRGQAVFEKRCTGCHSLTTDREGPRLQGVFGRPTASVPGFPYSASLRNAHTVWNADSLEKWLTEPDSFIAGSNMDFRVPKPQERRDLITFLAKSSGK